MGKEEPAQATPETGAEAAENAVDAAVEPDDGPAAFEADEADGLGDAEGAAPDLAEPVAERPRVGGGTAALRYTTLRLALFLGALVVIWGIARISGMDLSSQLSRLTLLAVAVLVSSAASIVLLSKQRDAMSAGLIARSERLSGKFNAASSFEDE